MKQNKIQSEKRMVCNGCGKEILMENSIVKEDYFAATHSFGYFSKTDGTQVSFLLCEDCFRAMLKQFKIPAKEIEKTELC